MVPLFGAAYAAPNELKKAPQFYTDSGLQKTVLNLLANDKFKDFLRPLSVFQVFSRQILFSRTFQDSAVYSTTFQACANPVIYTF